MDKENGIETAKNKGHKFIWIGFFSFAVLYPNTIVAVNGIEYLYALTIKKILFVLFSTLLFLLPLLFLRVRIYFLLVSPFVFFAPVEFFYRLWYRTELSEAVFGAILDTNMNELSEFIAGKEGLVLLPLLIFAAYLWVVRKQIDRDMNMCKKGKALFLLLAFLFFASLSTRDIVVAKENSIAEAYDSFVMRYKKTYPYGALSKIFSAANEKRELKTFQNRVEGFTFNAFKKDKLEAREIYVLILGEGARYINWGINGYSRDTSPKLSAMGDVVSYSNVISPATLTRTSVPIMITRATAENFEKSYEEKSLISAFKESGFKVYWVSNQAKYSEHDTSVAIHAMEADEAFFLDNDSKRPGLYDENLLPAFDDIISRGEQKLFIVLHTMGSHYNYSYRYPDEYDIYQPSLKGTKNVYRDEQDKKQLIVNSYDNSILYTDFFISSVINRTKKAGSLSGLVFISDHGENLLDDERAYFRHGYPEPSRYEVHIPMFIWLPDSYIVSYPVKSKNIIDNRDKKISSDALFYSLLDFGNIGYDGEDLTKSFASDSLREIRRKVLSVSDRIVEDENLY